MHLSDFDYNLPEELIANYPLASRDASRLLVAKPDGSLFDNKFYNLVELLKPNDLLVLNDSRVIKARLLGEKISGGKVEIMLERIIDSSHFIANIKTSKKIKLGLEIILPGGVSVIVTEKLAGLFGLTTLHELDLYAYLEQHGQLPIPPYFMREANDNDLDRYQTVFAAHNGSVAAPTAGLHFTPELISQLWVHKINIAKLTLHVGSGTFKPVKCENILKHKMHNEVYTIGEECIDLILKTKAAKGRIIAVGSTALRTLETIAHHGLYPQSGETNIFITPGYQFKLVDALITNFHLPKSTLIMLVSAFSGMELIKKAYNHAIAEKYRFFSYGDAMFLERKV